MKLLLNLALAFVLLVGASLTGEEAQPVKNKTLSVSLGHGPVLDVRSVVYDPKQLLLDLRAAMYSRPGWGAIDVINKLKIETFQIDYAPGWAHKEETLRTIIDGMMPHVANWDQIGHIRLSGTPFSGRPIRYNNILVNIAGESSFGRAVRYVLAAHMIHPEFYPPDRGQTIIVQVNPNSSTTDLLERGNEMQTSMDNINSAGKTPRLSIDKSAVEAPRLSVDKYNKREKTLWSWAKQLFSPAKKNSLSEERALEPKEITLEPKEMTFKDRLDLVGYALQSGATERQSAVNFLNETLDDLVALYPHTNVLILSGEVLNSSGINEQDVRLTDQSVHVIVMNNEFWHQYGDFQEILSHVYLDITWLLVD